MIVYHADKAGFQRDVETGDIDLIVLTRFGDALGRRTGASEVRSWHQSLTHMHMVLSDSGIPADCGVAVEMQIPQTSKRIDFLLSGRDEKEADRTIIVELKQWDSFEATASDGIVRAFVGGGVRDVPHPSYQAWSYAELLRGFNTAVYEGDISLHPCAYLHNLPSKPHNEELIYSDYTDKAPLFRKGDVQRLREFIKKYVKYGDRTDIIFRIDRGQIRPSKTLADSLAGLLEGNREFTLIDEQKTVFERALHLARTTPGGEKRVLIVHGGPGTGKSVVALNLLVELIRQRDLAFYVTKNAAPRAVFEHKLTGKMTKTRYANLFRGSGGFITADRGEFPVLIVDEAHRLNEKSGIYRNLGENQIDEIIRAADVSIFFLDEDQRVTLRDIGTRDEIVRWARERGAPVEEMDLPSQFRCNGSDGYLAWLDHSLQLRTTANPTLSGVEYDLRVLSTPNEVRTLIEERNRGRNASRMVAGYCWDWRSKKDPSAMDVTIPEHDFAMRWNLNENLNLWAVKPNSVSEVGCIHTCQGLELEYVGVIVGEDLVVRDGRVIAQPEKRSRQDQSISGYKKMLKEDPERARAEARAIVLNTYRTLMTRGMKGCYVYCVDAETQEYFTSVSRREVELTLGSDRPSA